MVCQHSAHVEQLSVLPICSGQRMASSGTPLGCSTEIVEHDSDGALEFLIAKRSQRCSINSASAAAIGSSLRQRAV
jgi:hypothetical protein